ncbi:MAG: sodium-dependent bicarbonate transport family permease [Pseudomonadota bacterium]
MGSFLDLAIANLTSPMILFFALGVVAALARSDLNIPEAIAKGLSIYLMMAIGFKGGASVAAHGVDLKLILSLLAGTALSALMPLLAFRLLMSTTTLPRIDAAAVAAHFGSISIVTFLAMTQALENAGLPSEGYMVAVAAAMETPAIIAALWLAYAGTGAANGGPAGKNGGGLDASTLREIFLNGSIVMLLGAFVIGVITGSEGLETMAPFIVSPFKGVLCLFLLDMGLLAGRGLREGRKDLTLPLIGFGIYMPLIGAVLGAGCGALIGLSTGGTALFAVLAASASYIAVPAAMRLALPDARPAIYLPLSLGVTFPFNLTIGIPVYMALAMALT